MQEGKINRNTSKYYFPTNIISMASAGYHLNADIHSELQFGSEQRATITGHILKGIDVYLIININHDYTMVTISILNTNRVKHISYDTVKI